MTYNTCAQYINLQDAVSIWREMILVYHVIFDRVGKELAMTDCLMYWYSHNEVYLTKFWKSTFMREKACIYSLPWPPSHDSFAASHHHPNTSLLADSCPSQGRQEYSVFGPNPPLVQLSKCCKSELVKC